MNVDSTLVSHFWVCLSFAPKCSSSFSRLHMEFTINPNLTNLNQTKCVTDRRSGGLQAAAGQVEDSRRSRSGSEELSQ